MTPSTDQPAAGAPVDARGSVSQPQEQEYLVPGSNLDYDAPNVSVRCATLIVRIILAGREVPSEEFFAKLSEGWIDCPIEWHVRNVAPAFRDNKDRADYGGHQPHSCTLD
jgi:hypothetical protein